MNHCPIDEGLDCWYYQGIRRKTLKEYTHSLLRTLTVVLMRDFPLIKQPSWRARINARRPLVSKTVNVEVG